MPRKINPNLATHEQYVLPHADTYKYKLDVLEFLFQHHEAVLNSIKRHTEIHLYPRQNDELAKFNNHLLKKLLVEGAPTDISTDNIILTNGSDSALKLLIEAFAIPGAKVLVPIPTYPHFISFLETSSYAETIKFQFDGTQVLPLQKCDLCYLVNPNLPLSYLIDIKKIEELLKSHPNTTFVVDEAYIEYVDHPTLSTIALINKYDNIIVTRTFSKAYGLAGLRLGYIIASAKMTKLLRVLSNNKSVTEIAISAANAVFDNIAHYDGLIKEVSRIKKILRQRLAQIVKIDGAEIYDFHVSHGNFFLIYARNPARVCDIFKAHKIYVRNKHDDVPHAIRICIAPENCMLEVLNLCLKININERAVIYDLDQTLRAGSTKYCATYPGVEYLLKNDNAYIYSNTGTYTPADVADYLRLNGIEFPEARIKTAISFAIEYVRKCAAQKEAPISICIIANKSAHNYIMKELHNVARDVMPQNNDTPIDICDPIPEYVLFLSDFYNLHSRTLIRICRMLQSGAKLIYADNSKFCTMENCADLDDSQDPTLKNIIVPDCAAYIQMLQCATACETIYIGKPNVEIPHGINPIAVVGDSEKTDGALAKKLNIPWIDASL